MNDIIFMPVSEVYYPTKNEVLYSRYKLGIFKVEFHLFDNTDLKLKKKTEEMVFKANSELAKKYFCIMNIRKSLWIWGTDNNLDVAIKRYKITMDKLKCGESIILEDANMIEKPIRISHVSLEFDW